MAKLLLQSGDLDSSVAGGPLLRRLSATHQVGSPVRLISGLPAGFERCNNLRVEVTRISLR